MIRSRDWMPQFNWPVFGPLLGILATFLIVGSVIAVRVWPQGETGTSITAAGTNPERDGPLSASPGTGGAGTALLPPEVRDLKVRSLSARVTGTPTVRTGPGTQYPGAYTLKQGEEVHVIACSPGCEWYRVLSLTDANAQLWVPGSFLAVTGKPESLPVLTPQ
jgi:hypothetical protein